MSSSIPESDWKYLRRIQPELLGALCSRINREAKSILESQSESEHEKYLRLFKHIDSSNRTLAECFDDWRRSNIWVKMLLLRREGLLTHEHLSKMSDQAKTDLEKSIG